MTERPDEMLPETIDCLHCGANMTLDEQERIEKRFICPACKEANDLANEMEAGVAGETVHPDQPAPVRVRPTPEKIPVRAASVPPDASGINYVALLFVAASVVSVFLPWVQLASGYMVSGMRFAAGLAVILLALAGGIVTCLKKKWGALAGAFNIVIAFGFSVWWFKLGGYATAEMARGGAMPKTPTPPQLGLYLLLFASLSFIVAVFQSGEQKRTGTGSRSRRRR
jgi:hypothetical protein